MNLRIIAADRVQDGQGSLEESEALISSASERGLRISKLEIVNLARRWEDKLGPLEFKSGASAMAAIEKARKLFAANKADLVVIHGTDLLRTGYAGNSRAKYMKLYGNKHTPLDGYNRLVPLFLKSHGYSEEDYFGMRDLLFQNYSRTWKRLHPEAAPPDEKWLRPLTQYFRGVDCANPNVDYTGRIVLSTEKVAKFLKVKDPVVITGNAFTKLNVDGIESLPKIAPYLHLKKTIDKALAESGVDFRKLFLEGKVLMDAYTCYPVVPMALVIRLGFAETPEEMKQFLKKHEVTVTGGLNLARAPWNLTSLNAIIAMREKLLSSKKFTTGLVHGNGSLGNQQGITLLQRTS